MPDDEVAKLEGSRIRSMRESMGMSRNQLAGRLGISPMTLKNAENGTQRLGVRTLREAELLSSTDATERKRMDVRCEEEKATHSPHANAANGIDESDLLKVIQAAADPAVKKAAQALADAAGITMEEALVTVITRMLR